MKLETNFIELIKNRLIGADKNSREKTYTFLLCLVISVFIWFLIALSSESSTSLEYPISFINAPDDMVLVNNPDSSLTFRIESGGFELLTLKYLSRRKPIKIDLGYLNLTEQNGYYAASYRTNQISADILKDYNFSEELVSISPESIHFRFERLEGKMVLVYPDVNFTFEKQYRLKGKVKVEPDSVKIIGPVKQLQEIAVVETQLYKVEAANNDGGFICRLKVPESNHQLNMIPTEVFLSWQVEKYTESTITVPIFTNRPENVKVFPATAEVTFLVGLENFNRINEDMFQVVAQLPDDPAILTANISIANFPSFVEIIRFNPEQVEYLILKE